MIEPSRPPSSSDATPNSQASSTSAPAEAARNGGTPLDGPSDPSAHHTRAHAPGAAVASGADANGSAGRRRGSKRGRSGAAGTRSVGAQRILKLRALRSLRARDVSASGRVAPSPARRGLKRGVGPRGLWLLSPLVVLALLFITGARYARQSVDVEKIARQQLIPQVEKLLGKRVEVGRVESDFFGRVTVHDIVIGRSKSSPIGALFRAKSATLSLDTLALLTKRSTPIGALRSVALDSPQVDLERGRDGKWNILQLVRKAPPGVAEKPVLAWSFSNGRIFLTDKTRVRNRKYLLVDARQIRASGRLNGARPSDFELDSPQVLLPPAVSAMQVRARGENDPAFAWAVSESTVDNLPLPAVALWALEDSQRRGVDFKSGTARLQSRIGFNPARPSSRLSLADLLSQGQASLRDLDIAVSGDAPALRQVLGAGGGTNRTLRVERGAVNLAWNNTDVEVRSASAQVLGTPLQARGALSWRGAGASPRAGASLVAGLGFDVRAQSAAWNIDAARDWLPPDARAALDRVGLRLEGAPNGEVRARGRADDARLSGDFALPRGSARGMEGGRAIAASWGAARTRFDARARTRNGAPDSLRGQVQFDSPTLQASRGGGAREELQASGARSLVRFAWRDRSAGNAARWSLSSDGSLSARETRLRAAGADAATVGTRASWRLAAQSSGRDFSASNLKWSGALQAQGEGARGEASVGRERARFANGAWAMRVGMPPAGGRGAGAAMWARDFSLSQGATLVSGRSARAEVGDFAFARGQASGRPMIRLAATGLLARDGNLGQAQLAEVRVQMASLGPSRASRAARTVALGEQVLAPELLDPRVGAWRTALSWRGADANGLRLARLSPVLAPLGRAGSSDGAASFPALDGPLLGRALSQIGAARTPGGRQVLAGLLARATAGGRGDVRVAGAVFDGIALPASGARWALESGALRFESGLPLASLSRSLQSPSLRARLGRNAFLLGAARDLANAATSGRGNATIGVRGRFDVARLAADDLARAGAVEVSTPQLAIDVARLNPWLASVPALAPGVSLRGLSGTARARLALRSRPGALDEFGVSWQLEMPRAGVSARVNPHLALQNVALPSTSLPVASRPEAVRAVAGGVRVRGNGTLRLGLLAPRSGAENRRGILDARSLRFSGATSVDVARVTVSSPQAPGAPAFPNTLSASALDGAQVQNVHVVARLSLDANRSGALGGAPLWAAQVRVGRASVPLPALLRRTLAGAPARIEASQLQFALDSGGRRDAAGVLAQVPRVSLALAGGRVDASARINRNGTLGLQILAANIDIARLPQAARQAQNLAAQAGVSPSTSNAALRTLLSAFATANARGRMWARVQASGRWPRFEVSTQARLLNARVSAPNAGTWPIDMARTAASIEIDASRIAWARLNADDESTWRGVGDLKIEEATLWSRGARLAFSGALNRTPPEPSTSAQPATVGWREAWTIRGRATANEIPLREAGRVPALAKAWRDADVEGALSGTFEASGTIGRPQVVGRTVLRLANVLGLRGDSIEVPIRASTSLGDPRAWLVEARGVRGKIENAPFSATLVADGAQNKWLARLQTRSLPSSRLLRGGGRLPANTFEGRLPNSTSTAALEGLRRVPLRGGVSADIDLAGSLFNQEGKIAPRPLAGTASVETGELRWRGRSVGSLSANVELDGRVLQIAGIQLFRSESRARDRARALARQITEGTDTPDIPTENDAPDELDEDEANPDPASRASLVQISGSVPLDPNAPGLELRLVSEDTALPVVLAGADELLRFLEGTPASTLTAPGVAPEVPEEIRRAREVLALLPRGVRGRVALAARVSGSVAAPRASVERLVLRDGAFITQDGEQILPTVDAAFDYDGIERALTIRKGLLVLAPEPTTPTTATTVEASTSTPPTTSIASTNGAEDGAADGTEDESAVPRGVTALRLVPGGRIGFEGVVNISGELLGADASLLARYVPALRGSGDNLGIAGRLEELKFTARGALESPTVTGSVRARGLAVRDNTLDMLEVSAFRIGDGFFTIKRGDLRLEKGDFRSTSASVDIPWTWGGDGQAPGPRREAAIRVSLPVANKEFGALAGVLVPALQRADAREFSGLIELGGTIDTPRLSGEVTIRDGRFRLAPNTLPFDVGMEEVSGRLLIVDGNRLVIDPANSLQGRIVPAGSISAPETGNRPNSNRLPVPPGGVAPRATATAPANAPSTASPDATEPSTPPVAPPGVQVVQVKPEKKGKSKVDEADLLSGRFAVGGSAVFDLSPQVLASPIQTLSSHFYDLRVSLDRVQAGGSLGGLREISLGAHLKTQGASAASGQTVRWLALARGGGSSKKRSRGLLERLGLKRGPKTPAATTVADAQSGAVLTFGALQLRSDFPSGLEALSRSQAQPLGDPSDMADLPVLAQVRAYMAATGRGGTLAALLNETPQVRFEKLKLRQDGFGSATIDGTLSLDNALPSASPAPQTPPARNIARRISALSPAATGKYLSGAPSRRDTTAPLFSSLAWKDSQGVAAHAQVLAGWNGRFDSSDAAREAAAPGKYLRAAPLFSNALFVEPGVPQVRRVQFAPNPSEQVLRVSGALTIEDAEISGAPPNADVSTAGEMPAAPLLDVSVTLGRSVRVATPNLRTEVVGSLRVTGSPREPFAAGLFETRSGSVRFPGANARILNGRIEVSLRRDPETRQLRPIVTLDVAARGQVGNDAITVAVRGPVDLSADPRSALSALGERGGADARNLRVDVTSSRGLSQDEAFARLFGTAPRSGSANSINGGAYAQAVASLLSAPLFSGLERSLEQILGLDSLTLEYRFNEPSAIQIGKAIGDRVFVTYRRTIGGSRTAGSGGGTSSAAPGDSLRVEYRLKGDVQIVYQIGRDQIGSFSDTISGLRSGGVRRTLSVEKTWRF